MPPCQLLNLPFHKIYIFFNFWLITKRLCSFSISNALCKKKKKQVKQYVIPTYSFQISSPSAMHPCKAREDRPTLCPGGPCNPIFLLVLQMCPTISLCVHLSREMKNAAYDHPKHLLLKHAVDTAVHQSWCKWNSCGEATTS